MQRKYDNDNVFLKILEGKIPCNKVYEDESILAFYDINPKAPVHVLVIPKNKYVSFNDFVEKATDEEVLHFFKTAQKIAMDLNLKSYRIVANCGEEAGQVVFHYHLHIMGYR